MIDLDKAKERAYAEIKEDQGLLQKEDPADNLVIEKVVEFDSGWLFFFNSKRYLETRNILFRPLGLGPVIVGKNDGRTYRTRSIGNEHSWIKEFREFLSKSTQKR
jgi:hypothetical protein